VPPSGLNPNSRIFCKDPPPSGISTRNPLRAGSGPTLLLMWAIRMPGRCGYWFAWLLVLSPEGWYTLCRGRRPRLQVQSKMREARRADTQDLPIHSWSFPRVLSQPSRLDECQSVWAITAKQPYARSAPSTPPPLAPPAKAPVEKGGQAVGSSGRIDGPETSQALKGRNLAPCCQGAVTQASSNSACFMLFPAVTK
jgi:hypothetical protein